MRPKQRDLSACALLLPLCAAGLAQGATAELEAELGIGRSDNFERSASDARAATLKSAGLRFSLLQDTRRLDADLVGDVALVDYNGSRYSSEVTGSVAGRLGLTLIEDRLRWIVEDSFGQARLDPFSVPAPENKEQVNYFSTGPILNMGLGLRDTNLLLSGRYTRVDFETSPSNSYRLEGQAGVERLLSSAARLGIYAGTESVEPSGANPGESYDRAAAFARYSITGARGSLVVDGGANRIKSQGMSESGPMFRIELARDVGRMTRLVFGLGQEFSDAGAGLRPPTVGALPSPTHNTQSLLQATEPFTLRYAHAGWTITGRRTVLGLNIRGAEEDYEGASQPDRKRAEAGLALIRQVGRRTEVSVGANLSTNDFEAPQADFDEQLFSASILWRAARRTRIELSGERYGFSPDMPGGTLDETRYWLRLRYGDRLTRAFAP